MDAGVPFFFFLFRYLKFASFVIFDRGLYSNNISGKIPEDLGSLENLLSLDLYLNSLSGTIPDTLGKLAKLRFLYGYSLIMLLSLTMQPICLVLDVVFFLFFYVSNNFNACSLQ